MAFQGHPFSQPPPHLPFQGQPPGVPIMTDPHLAALQQQGYMAQQQQLAALAAAQNPGGPGMPPQAMPGMAANPALMAQMAAMRGLAQAPLSSKKSKKSMPRPAQQVMPQHMRPLPVPTSREAYLASALRAPPGMPVSIPGLPPAMAAPVEVPFEPWADAIDELDPRELAMARFRSRQEILSEVFGPDALHKVPVEEGDAWAGLGMDGETLEAKVLALEAENEALATASETVVDAFRRQLEVAEQAAAA
ncbi:hypothetical protein Q5752_000502 [Cryptotrichosporon argae]